MILLLIIGSVSGLETFHGGSVRDGGVLAPQYFNLASKSSITASATCGEEKPELFCKLSAGSDYGQNQFEEDYLYSLFGTQGTGGQYCDICDAKNSSKSHSIEFAKDGTERWWQSPPLSSNTATKDLNKVNITIDMHQLFHVAYVIIKFANSPRAGKWVLERSIDGINYTPWQYFVNNYHECEMEFDEMAVSANEQLEHDDDVRCTQDFSEIPPLENGEVIVSLIKGRPGASNFWSSPTLQAWTKASHIRLRFEQAKTLLGHLMGIMENDETVTRRYYYSIKDITIGGRCDCNGHADKCLADAANDFKLACQCKHNTQGISCGECKPLFNQRKWRHAERNNDNECEKCNCHNHADSCFYDDNIERDGLSLNMLGGYSGGGHCVDCKHNTVGINCEKCASGYFRNMSVSMDDEFACLECNCPSNFTDTSCDHDTGACKCKEKYSGHNCRECAEGFTEFPECNSCECHYHGTLNKQCSPTTNEDGQEAMCQCKENFTGPLCNQCADGYFNFPECVPCECSDLPGSMAQYPCDKETGGCVCKDGFEGLDCELCATKYYNYPSCIRCPCSAAGVTESFCDANSTELVCHCSERYTGVECRECAEGFHSFPTCGECDCASPGTQLYQTGEPLPCDAVAGQCTCKPEYTGLSCDECSDGYFKTEAGFCVPCDCNEDGTEPNSFCDKQSGACRCKENTSGRACDECGSGFFNFPGCQKCPCNPAGIYNYNPEVCSYFDAGEKCSCKINVEGKFCDQCRNRFWELSESNTAGCKECSCWNDGLLNEIKDCSSDNGQCKCKSRVCSQRCSKCEDGYFGLEGKNYFGCQDCQCDVGGTLGGALGSMSCNKKDGQCECKDHVEGRKCDTVEPGFCFSTLYQYQFEAEDSFLENGEKVRYGFDKYKFPDYSLRGYAELSDIQSSIKMSGRIEKSYQPTVPLYKIVAHFTNPTHQTISGRVMITDFNCINQNDCKTIQESVIQFIQTEKPEHRFFETDAVLVEGNYTFKLSIDTDDIDWNSDGLFIDYIALLPSQYYEPNILKKKITEPCSYSEKVGDKCMMYDHVSLNEYHTIEEYSLHKLPLLNFDIEPALLFNTKPGQIQPFNRMLTIDAAADPSTAINTLYAQTTPPGAGEYVVIIDYVNPIDQYQQMKVNVNLQRSGIARVETVIFNIYSCDYLFTCRQVGLDRSGAVKKIQLEYLQTYFTFLDDQPLNRLKVYIDKVYLIPAEDFDVEMVEPKAKCVTDIGPRFEGCYPSIYPSRPAQGMELSHRNWTSTFQTETFTVTGVELSAGKSTFVFGNIHPANYVFVIQYNQRNHLAFNLTIDIESIESDFHNAHSEMKYCALSAGCRSLIENKGVHSFSIQKDTVEISLIIPEGKSVFIEKIIAIPEPNWSMNHLNLDQMSFADAFITNCGFHIDPAKSSNFCLESARSLVMSNTEAKKCQCAMAGTIDGAQCEPYGCQCECKANVIGKDCSRCAVGYYNWPECTKCDCVGNTICNEETGECLCPPNTADDCMSCAADAYGYHHIAGCYECQCSIEGTINNDSSCDLKTGHCQCSPNVTGRKCDRCEDGYYGYPNCKKCDCDELGTVDSSLGQCDVITGKCQCKNNVEGLNCSKCKQGTFFLAKDHPDGCIACYCSGLIALGKNHPECSPSDFATAIVSDMSKGSKDRYTKVHRGWSVQGMNSNNYFEHINDWNGFVYLDVAKGGGQADRSGIGGSSPKPLYWIAPETYHGNRLGSYGGKLKYSISWDEERKDKIFNNGFERLNVDPDVTLTGGGISIGWVSKDHTTVNSNMTIEVILMETNFFNLGTKKKISREEMLTVLKDLADIKIKASYPVAVSEIGIQNMELQVTDFSDRLSSPYEPEIAREYSFGSRVEVCNCPIGHKGSSCEECAEGYYWDRSSSDPSQKCEKCKCHGHCDICDENGYPFIEEKYIGYGGAEAVAGAEEQTVEIIYGYPNEAPEYEVSYHDKFPAGLYQYDKKRCKHNTIGKECELCAPGYIGDATKGLTDDCKPCPCPAPHNNHADSCGYQPIEDMASAASDFSLVGFTDTSDYSSMSSDVANAELGKLLILIADANSPGNQDKYEIVCKCSDGYSGANCDECDAGFYGRPDMINQGCKKCNCNGNSDPSFGAVQCDKLDGTCTACVHGTAGKNCEKCAIFKYGDPINEKSCRDCPCEKCGSVDCDGTTGDCQCKPNVVGDLCETCAPGFWDFDACLLDGCRDCQCDQMGSISLECNQTSGVCDCKPGVDGNKCDVCAAGYWNLSKDGCEKCDCPPGLPCDATTGKCFCPEGIIGDRCDQCENPRSVPVKQDGNTACKVCDQCIDWLLGPTEVTGVWVEDQDYSRKAIQPLTHIVLEKQAELQQTKAHVFTRNRLANLYLEVDQTMINVENRIVDNKHDQAVFMKTLAEFNHTHLKLYQDCEHVHHLFDETNHTDYMGNQTLLQLKDIQQFAMDINFTSHSQVNSLELASYSDDVEYEAEKERMIDQIERLRNMKKTIIDIKDRSNVEHFKKESHDLWNNVKDRFDTFYYNKTVSEYVGGVNLISEKLDDFKNRLDEATMVTSETEDKLKSLENQLAAIEMSNKKLETELLESYKYVKGGVTMNNGTRHILIDAKKQMEIVENLDLEIISNENLEILPVRIDQYKTALDESTIEVTEAERHTNLIQERFEDLNAIWTEYEPALQQRLKDVENQNLTEKVNQSMTNWARAVELVNGVQESLIELPTQGDDVGTCISEMRHKKSEIDARIESIQEVYSGPRRDFDRLQIEFADIQAALDFEDIDMNAFDDMSEFNFIEKEILHNETKFRKDELETRIQWIEEFGSEREKTLDAVDTANAANRELNSLIDMVSDTLNPENENGYSVKIEGHKTSTLDTMNEIDQLLLNIREEIERTQTLVNEVSQTVKVDYRNDYIRHNRQTLPGDIDVSVFTEISLNFKLNSSASHLASIVDQTNPVNRFELMVRGGFVECTFVLGDVETTLRSNINVFETSRSVQKWFNVRASRFGKHGILEVTELKTNGKRSNPDIVEAEADTKIMRWDTVETHLTIGGPQSSVSIIDVEVNSAPVNQWMYAQKSEDFTNSDVHFDLDKFNESYKKKDEELTCDGSCWTFTGENSWAFITEANHEKFLINTRTGTIMFQMKLKQPIQANGLIFFVGDPTQNKYFIAMDIKDGSPRFIYNLNYEHGAQVITLEEGSSLYQQEMNIRIGMVGGVAGLAIQEWKKSKVKPIENDRLLKAKTDQCPTCQFMIDNQMHFGGIKTLGRNLSHLDDMLETWNTPYRGCMHQPTINHKDFDMSLEGVKKSNIYEGCRTEQITKLSFDGTAAIKRSDGIGSLKDVMITFGFSISAGYTSQDAIICRVAMINSGFFIEFGMEKGKGFYYKSELDGKHHIALDIVADTFVNVAIERDQSVSQTTTVLLQAEKTTYPLTISDIKPTNHEEGKMEVTFGAQVKGTSVSKGFNGCIEGAFINTFKLSDSRNMNHVFTNFQCFKERNDCLGNIRFNECHTNVAYKLIQAPSSPSEMMTVVHRPVHMERPIVKQRNKERNNRRKGDKLQGCPAYPNPSPKTDGFDFKDRLAWVKFNTRSNREKLRDDFDLYFEVFPRSGGNVLQLIGDDCNQRISLSLKPERAGARLIVDIKMGKNEFSFSSKKLKKSMTHNVLFRTKKDGSKTKFILETDPNNHKSRTIRRFPIALQLKNIYGGVIPDVYKCNQQQRAFDGFLISPKLNSHQLKAKRVENVSSVFSGMTGNDEGLYLQNTKMNINLPNVETVTFRMQAHKRVGDPERHFTFFNMTSQNGGVELALFDKDMVLITQQQGVAQKIEIPVQTCVQDEIRVIIRIISDSIHLYVNGEIEEISIDPMNISNIQVFDYNGCLSDFKINEKPFNTYSPTFYGNEYSVSHCPV